MNSPDVQSRRSFLDVLTIVMLVAFGFGNLIIPAALQSVLGVDYIFVTVGVLAIILVLRLPKIMRTTLPWLVTLLLVVAAAWGWYQVSPNSYGESKLQTFAIAAVVVLSASGIRDVDKSLRLAVVLSLWISGLTAVGTILLGEAAANGRVSILGLNPIGVARASAWMPAAAVLIALSGRRPVLVRAAFLGIGLFAGLAAFTTGSRGPIVSAAAAIVVGAVALTVAGRLRAIFMAGASVAALAVAPIVVGTSGFQRIISGGDSGRTGIFETAIGIALRHPGGVGWGRFGDYAPGLVEPGQPAYPHNLFLELWVEGGFVSVVAVGLVFVLVLPLQFRVVRRDYSTPNLLVLVLLVYAIANAQFSSDIIGNRMLWLALALVAATCSSWHTKRRAAAKSDTLVTR